jgi:hypothetical protein
MVSPAQLLGGSIPPQAHDMLMGLKGAAHAGQVPMQPAGGIEQKYPQLRAKSTVDWHRVNPRLLQLLNKQGEKTGDVIVLSSGYRDNQYNAAAGGHPQSNHRLGLSVDAHINGHPIGEVIDPQSLIKVGLHVGGPNGDPSHVDLSGIPIKNQQKAQPSSGKESAPTPPPGPGPGPGADAGGDPLAALMAQMQASGGPGASNQ